MNSDDDPKRPTVRIAVWADPTSRRPSRVPTSHEAPLLLALLAVHRRGAVHEGQLIEEL